MITGVFALKHDHALSRLWVRRLCLSLLLLLLLSWQQAAASHALVHQIDVTCDDPTLPPHAACMLCVAYAGAGGALPGAAPEIYLAEDAKVVSGEQPVVIGLPALPLPYQVRAPPEVLA